MEEKSERVFSARGAVFVIRGEVTYVFREGFPFRSSEPTWMQLTGYPDDPVYPVPDSVKEELDAVVTRDMASSLMLQASLALEGL